MSKNFADILSVAAEFYKNYPDIQPLFPEQQKLLQKVLKIINSSVFLNAEQKRKLKTVARFFGESTLKTIADSLIRQNIRFLINKIKQNGQRKK